MACAEDLQSSRRIGFTCQWNIENLSMFGVLEKKELLSPKFTVNFLYDSEWYLKLVLTEDIKSAMCFLHRTNSGRASSIKIAYSFSFGSLFSVGSHTFGENSSSTMLGNIDINEFACKIELGHAKDILQIECNLNMAPERGANPSGNVNALPSPYPVSCSLRTIIVCETRNVFLSIKNFSTRPEGSTESVCVDSVLNEHLKFICEFSKTSVINLRHAFRLNVSRPDSEDLEAFVIKYRVNFVDTLGKHHLWNSGRVMYSSCAVPPHHEKLLQSAESSTPLKGLAGDVLLFHCEFTVSANESVCLLESTRYDTSYFHGMDVSWSVYLDHKYNKHRFLFRLLAVLAFIISLIIPYLITNPSL